MIKNSFFFLLQVLTQIFKYFSVMVLNSLVKTLQKQRLPRLWRLKKKQPVNGKEQKENKEKCWEILKITKSVGVGVRVLYIHQFWGS